MLGALIKVTGVISLDSLIEKVENMFLRKIGKEKTQANIDAIKEAYGKVG